MQIRPLDTYLNAQLQGQRFIVTLFAIFAAVALGIGVSTVDVVRSRVT